MRKARWHSVAIMAACCPLVALAADEEFAEPGAQEIRQRYRALAGPSKDLLEKFHKHTFTHADGRKLPYRLFRPEKTDAGKKLPLVVFLHGLGGKGSGNVKQMTDQIVCPSVWALPENQAKHPCYVLAPQSSGYGGFMCWTTQIAPMAKALIDKIVEENDVDRDRIYVTGLSMGGYGTWNMLTMYPDFFAAGVPVCGRGDPSKAHLLVKHKVAVWAFHGARDPVVKVTGSRDMIEAMKKAGGRPRYTEYPDLEHNSWEGAYSDRKLIEWVFSQFGER